MCKGPMVERNNTFKQLDKDRSLAREAGSCKVSQAMADCGLYEKPSVSIKGKEHNQMYVIKHQIIHTVRMDLYKSLGNPGGN